MLGSMRYLGMVSLMFFSFAIPVAAAANERLESSAEDVLGRIADEGGEKVLWHLLQEEKAFENVLDGIESGDVDWLKVAVELHRFSDAAAALSLDYAIARAIPAAPEAVLALIGAGIGIDCICTSPFIEPESGVAEDYERRALTALSMVKHPVLVSLAAQCSREIRSSDES